MQKLTKTRLRVEFERLNRGPISEDLWNNIVPIWDSSITTQARLVHIVHVCNTIRPTAKNWAGVLKLIKDIAEGNLENGKDENR